MRTIIKKLVLVTLAIFSLTGCKNQIKDKDAIKIGVIAPLSGEFSRFGIAMQRGINLAIEDLEKTNIQYSAIFQDDKGNNREATNAFVFLKDVKNVPIILGAAKSGTSQILAPIANESKVVLFSSISTADTLKYAGDFFFRNVPANSTQAMTLADYVIQDIHAKSVGVLYENNEYGVNMKHVFQNYFLNQGGKIIYSLPYEEKQTDFKTIIDKISKSNVEIIFIPGTVWGIAMLIRQLRERGVNTPIITGDGGYGAEDMTKIAGKTANGYICSFMSIEDTTNIKYRNFDKNFVAKYQMQPDIYSAYSYDAVMIVNKAIKSIKDIITGEAIKNELYKVEYEGICGKYKFDSFGEVNKPFGLYLYNDGKYTRIK